MALASDDTLLLLLSVLLVALVAVLLVVVRHYRDRVADLAHRLRSREVTYGKISEQFAPFVAQYPFDPQHFRFLGSPVDGVQFEPDRIVFVEFKTNTSRLSPKQRDIRKLVEEKRVEWLTFELREG